MLELKDVGKRYKKQTIFSGLNEVISPGVTILTGPSGVGKSTLLRLCATVEKPSNGHVLWQGRDIQKSRREFRKILGYAPQIIDFPEDLSAADFMLHIAAMKSIKTNAASAQSKSILERIGLGPDLHKRIGSFSGGMRRRLGLAQAFLGAPKCLIIDEPTAELDPQTSQKVHDMIFEVGQSTTILMTTHLESSLSHYTYNSLHMSGS